VEFDDGLNHAIRRLRHALSDTAQVPHYIETIPRRGYRFMLPVEFESRGPLGPSSADQPACRRQFGLSRALVAAGTAAVIVVLVMAIIQRRSVGNIESLAVTANDRSTCSRAFAQYCQDY